MNIEIANRLVQLRKQNGLSQEELAARIGISRQAVSKWERAEASPDTDNLILLARLYRVSLDDLLRTEEEIPAPEPEEANPDGELPPVDQHEGAPESSAGPMPSAGESPAPGKPQVDIGWGHIRVMDGDEQVDIGPGHIHVQDGDEQVHLGGGGVLVTKDGKTMEAWKWKKHRWLAFPYPVLVTIVFLLLGFLGGWWHPGWVVFLTIPVYYGVVDLVMGKTSIGNAVFPVLTLIAFLLLGFLGGWWYWCWLVFLTIPLYYSAADIIRHKKSWKQFPYPVVTVIVFFLLGFWGGWWAWAWVVFLTIPLYYALFPDHVHYHDDP